MQILANSPSNNYRSLSSQPAASPAPAPASPRAENDELVAARAAASKIPTVIGTGLGVAVGAGISSAASFGVAGLLITTLAVGAFGYLTGTAMGIQAEVMKNPEKYPDLSKRLSETMSVANH